MSTAEQIEAMLRSDLPRPSPAFVEELEGRVREGFPRPQRKLPALRRLWPAFAAPAVAAVVTVVVLSSGGTSPKPQPAVRAAQAPPLQVFNDAIQRQQLSSAPSPVRQVQRDVQLTIAAPRDKLQQAADGVGTVAQSHGGFVLNSHVTTGTAAGAGGDFELRVPQRELQATIADLSRLGDLRSRSESAQDLTAPYNSVQNRLGDALVERTTLRLRLRRAHGAKADEIRTRLAQLAQTIGDLNGRMRDLRSRTTYSTISVTLEQAAKKKSGGTAGAFDDAGRILKAMLNFAVRALAVILPLALLALAGAFAARLLRRRRREATLL